MAGRHCLRLRRASSTAIALDVRLLVAPGHRARRIASTASVRCLVIVAIAHSRLYLLRTGTQMVVAIWRMSNAQALIFIAVVVIAVALVLMLLA